MSFRKLIGEIHRRSIWQVLGIYLLAGWVALQVIETLTDSLGLPDWFPAFAVVLLIIGFPIVLATAFLQHTAAARADPGSPVAPGDGTPAAHASVGHAGTTAAEIGATRDFTVRRLFTWRNALTGGIAAFALWGVIAAGWVLLSGGDAPGSRERTGLASIAVLPFANMGNDENAYFADGIHEDILTQLSKVGSLKVISRTSVLAYRGVQKNIRDIARELGVDHVLEGSVRYDAAGNRVRVVAQLIDARTDEHVWADQYDRPLTDVFALQSELALSIVGALRAAVTPDEQRRIEKGSALSTAAYDLILRGRESYGRGLEGNRLAIELFRQAVRLDPQSAEAHAELANALGQHAQLGAGREWADSALAEAEIAVRLDPELPLAYKALGLSHNQAGRLGQSRQAYQRAIELNPNYETALINLAVNAEWSGRFDDAIPLLERAHAVAPGHRFATIHLAIANAAIGRTEEAWRWLDRTRAAAPGFVWLPFGTAYVAFGGGPADMIRADSLMRAMVEHLPSEPSALVPAAEFALLNGDHALAREHYERVLSVAPVWQLRGFAAFSRSGLALLLQRAGESERPVQLLRDQIAFTEAAMAAGDGDVQHLQAMALLHAVAGNRAAALDWLERAAATLSHFEVEQYSRDPRFAAVRSDPRFAAALQRGRVNVASMRAAVEAWEATRTVSSR